MSAHVAFGASTRMSCQLWGHNTIFRITKIPRERFPLFFISENGYPCPQRSRTMNRSAGRLVWVALFMFLTAGLAAGGRSTAKTAAPPHIRGFHIDMNISQFTGPYLKKELKALAATLAMTRSSGRSRTISSRKRARKVSPRTRSPRPSSKRSSPRAASSGSSRSSAPDHRALRIRPEAREVQAARGDSGPDRPVLPAEPRGLARSSGNGSTSIWRSSGTSGTSTWARTKPIRSASAPDAVRTPPRTRSRRSR